MGIFSKHFRWRSRAVFGCRGIGLFCQWFGTGQGSLSESSHVLQSVLSVGERGDRFPMFQAGTVQTPTQEEPGCRMACKPL